MLKSTGLAIISLIFFMSCQSTYYKAWEFLGREKRDLLKSEIKDAKTQQTETQEELKDALETIRAQYDLKGGGLEKLYDRLKDDYQDSRQSQAQFNDRANRVRRVAQDLFKEWEKEARQLDNAKYKRISMNKLSQTKSKYKQLSSKMQQSEKRLDRVLKVMQDQVIFLKHNLNAQSLDVFKREFKDIEKEIETLIITIQNSIQATEEFENTMAFKFTHLRKFDV